MAEEIEQTNAERPEIPIDLEPGLPGQETPELSKPKGNIVLKETSYNGQEPLERPLTVSEFEGNTVYLAEYADYLDASLSNLAKSTDSSFNELSNSIKKLQEDSSKEISTIQDNIKALNDRVTTLERVGKTVLSIIDETGVVSGNKVDLYYVVNSPNAVKFAREMVADVQLISSAYYDDNGVAEFLVDVTNPTGESSESLPVAAASSAFVQDERLVASLENVGVVQNGINLIFVAWNTSNPKSSSDVVTESEEEKPSVVWYDKVTLYNGRNVDVERNASQVVNFYLNVQDEKGKKISGYTLNYTDQKSELRRLLSRNVDIEEFKGVLGTSDKNEESYNLTAQLQLDQTISIISEEQTVDGITFYDIDLTIEFGEISGGNVYQNITLERKPVIVTGGIDGLQINNQPTSYRNQKAEFKQQSTSGSGSGLELTVEFDKDGYVLSYTITNPGTDYVVNDLITTDDPYSGQLTVQVTSVSEYGDLTFFYTDKDKNLLSSRTVELYSVTKPQFKGDSYTFQLASSNSTDSNGSANFQIKIEEDDKGERYKEFLIKVYSQDGSTLEYFELTSLRAAESKQIKNALTKITHFSIELLTPDGDGITGYVVNISDDKEWLREILGLTPSSTTVESDTKGVIDFYYESDASYINIEGSDVTFRDYDYSGISTYFNLGKDIQNSITFQYSSQTNAKVTIVNSVSGQLISDKLISLYVYQRSGGFDKAASGTWNFVNSIITDSNGEVVFNLTLPTDGKKYYGNYLYYIYDGSGQTDDALSIVSFNNFDLYASNNLTIEREESLQTSFSITVVDKDEMPVPDYSLVLGDSKNSLRKSLEIPLVNVEYITDENGTISGTFNSDAEYVSFNGDNLTFNNVNYYGIRLSFDKKDRKTPISLNYTLTPTPASLVINNIPAGVSIGITTVVSGQPYNQQGMYYFSEAGNSWSGSIDVDINKGYRIDIFQGSIGFGSLIWKEADGVSVLVDHYETENGDTGLYSEILSLTNGTETIIDLSALTTTTTTTLKIGSGIVSVSVNGYASFGQDYNDGTYTSVSGYSVDENNNPIQSGSGALFDLVISQGEPTITVVSPGDNYVVGEQIWLPGNQLGGTTGNNALRIIVTATTESASGR